LFVASAAGGRAGGRSRHDDQRGPHRSQRAARNDPGVARLARHGLHRARRRGAAARLMRAAATVVARELGRRHRAALFGLAGYLLYMATIKVLTLGGHVHLGTDEAFAFTMTVPFTVTCMYLLVVFTYGADGDFNGRASTYPGRKFTLPVT